MDEEDLDYYATRWAEILVEGGANDAIAIQDILGLGRAEAVMVAEHLASGTVHIEWDAP